MLKTKAETLITTNNEFNYKLKYKVLICKRCKQAVRGLKTHLEDAYRLNKKERQSLFNRYSALQLAKLEDVLVPQSNGPPFVALGEPIAAFQCEDCSHISINRKSMRGHCNKKHQWRYSKEDPVR